MKTELMPIIQVDTREQRPLVFESYTVEVVGLPVGDYGLKHFSGWDNPQFVCERKSLDDLCGSLGHGRDRFMREVEKLRQFRFRCLIVEATRDTVEMAAYRSTISPQSILATLDALAVRAGIHIFWCRDPSGAARQVESLVRQFIRGIIKDARRIGGFRSIAEVIQSGNIVGERK